MTITAKFAILLLVLAIGTVAAVGAYYGYVTRNDETHVSVVGSLAEQCARLHRRIDSPAPLTPEERDKWRLFALVAQATMDALPQGGVVDGRYVGRIPVELSAAVEDARQQWRATKSLLLESMDAGPAYEISAQQRLHRAFPRYQAAIGRLLNSVESRRTSLRNHMWNTFWVICGIHFIFLVIGVSVMRRVVVRPILLVKAAAREIASGNYSQMVPVISKDETGDLASAFNGMTRELGTTIQSLRTSEQALADKAAELAIINAELEQYAYAASHDLNEPLRMVVTYSQLLRRQQMGHLNADSELYLSFIEKGAERMQQLIADLLSYSRVLHTGESSTPVDCNAAVRAAMIDCSAAINETGAEIRYESLPPVLADRVELEIVFRNLISNAIKYRGASPPAVEITAESDNDLCTIRVHDNGIGIREEYHQRIFGLFKRLHGREIPGTGVGLALTKKIIEKHGGDIQVESHDGQGTTFVFTLPVAPAGSAPVAEFQQAS